MLDLFWLEWFIINIIIKILGPGSYNMNKSTITDMPSSKIG